MKIHCQTPDISIRKEEIKLSVYTIEDKLYSRFLNNYEIKTQKQLKRW